MVVTVTAGDLAAFLADRYDEAEALAKAAEGARWLADVSDGEAWLLSEDSHLLDGHPATIAYIAAVDPAHRLADIKLKRAILAGHGPLPFWGNMPPPLRDRTPENAVAWFCDCQSEDGVITAEYPCATVRQLGTEFSGHPGYKQEWAPEGAPDGT